MGTISGYRPTRLANCLRSKLDVDFGSGSELCGWYYLDGKKTLRVTVPKGHGHSEISHRVMKRITNSLRINEKQFDDLYRCPMSGSDFEQVIRSLNSTGKV